jgi:hypothetical protein
MYADEYNSKVQAFISDNNFTPSKQDVTKKLQSATRYIVNECNVIIPKDKKWKYINLNPSTPSVRDLIKFHTVDAPIRPIVDWTNAPAYKLAKLLVKQLQLHTPLLHAFTVQNTPHLIKGLSDIPYNNKVRLASFDISNMYTNIPTNQLITIIKLTCQNNYVDKTRHATSPSLPKHLSIRITFASRI